MKLSNTMVCCTAASAALFLISGSRLTGQSQGPAEHGRSFAVHAAGAALPAELARMDAMLRAGDLDIASSQEDTMIAGRVHERLKQMYKGLPVFGSGLMRQIDGRSVV